MNKISFEVNGVKLAVVRPNSQQLHKADIAHAKAFAEYAQAGALLEEALDGLIKSQQLWDEAKLAKWDELVAALKADERIVEGKVAGTTLEQAKEAAIRMRINRVDINEMLAERAILRANTAQGKAENARFNYLVAACTIHEDMNKPYFLNREHYETSDDPVKNVAAKNMADLLHGYDPDFEKKFPENKFLLKYGLVDENLQFKQEEAPKTEVKEEPTYPFIDDKGSPLPEEVVAEKTPASA